MFCYYFQLLPRDIVSSCVSWCLHQSKYCRIMRRCLYEFYPLWVFHQAGNEQLEFEKLYSSLIFLSGNFLWNVARGSIVFDLRTKEHNPLVRIGQVYVLKRWIYLWAEEALVRKCRPKPGRHIHGEPQNQDPKKCLRSGRNFWQHSHNAAS